MDISVVAIGALGGAAYGLLGAAKNKTNPDGSNPFSWKLFFKSVVTGAAIGGVVSYGGGTVSFENIETFVATSSLYPMITAVVNKVTGILWNFVKRV